MYKVIGYNRNLMFLKNEIYFFLYVFIISLWSGVNNWFFMLIDKVICNGVVLNFFIKLILVKMKLVKYGYVFNFKKLK